MQVKDMQEKERQARAQAITENIDVMLTFADQQEDFLLAAKLEDVRVLVTERYLCPIK